MRTIIFSVFIMTFFVIGCKEKKQISIKTEKVYLDYADSTKNCYTILYPPKTPWTGYIFLLPGFGETAERVLQQTDLPEKLAKSGILTVIPTFEDGVLSFGVDSSSQQSFNRILKDINNKNNLTGKRFYVGGYSIGGSCTIKYAENPTIKPTAIFAIDPPLDFERLYNSAVRDIRLSTDNNPNEENTYIIERLEKEIGGSPETNLSNYYKFSPYSFSDTTQMAIRKLLNIPLRIYTEPDVSWWMKERKVDYTGMNSTECSAMVNELHRLGNSKVELITTQNKGFRKPDNERHPHSWSIVDNDELIKWLLSQK